MADIEFVAIKEPEEVSWPEQIKLIMPGEPASGGEGSPENTQAAQLAARTQWLKKQTEGFVGLFVNMQSDSELAKALTQITQNMLFDLLKPITSDEAPVLIGYNPVTKSLFGYPMGQLVVRAERLSGGNPLMNVGDYADGRISGGNPSMQISDYMGYSSGGNPRTF